MDDIRAIFRKVYNGGYNFMTPTPEKYGKHGKFIYEISSGIGMRSDTIYGLTILENVNGEYKRRNDLNGCHKTLRQAELELLKIDKNWQFFDTKINFSSEKAFIGPFLFCLIQKLPFIIIWRYNYMIKQRMLNHDNQGHVIYHAPEKSSIKINKNSQKLLKRGETWFWQQLRSPKKL